MERHILLHYIQHHQQFTQRMLPHSSVLKHTAERHLLSSAPGSQPLYFAAPVPHPVTETDFSRSQTSPYASDELYEKRLMPMPAIPDTTELPDQSSETASSRAKFIADAQNNNHHKQELPASATNHAPHQSVKVDTSRPEPIVTETLAQTPPSHLEHDTLEPDLTPPAPLSGHETHNHSGSHDTLPTRRPRRARIEEQPSRLPQSDAPNGLTASYPEPDQQAETVQRQTKAPQHAMQDDKKRTAQAEADALFTSVPARSPQEWLAKLLSSEKQGESLPIVAPATNNNERETEQGRYEQTSVPAPTKQAQGEETDQESTRPLTRPSATLYPQTTSNGQNDDARRQGQQASVTPPIALKQQGNQRVSPPSTPAQTSSITSHGYKKNDGQRVSHPPSSVPALPGISLDGYRKNGNEVVVEADEERSGSHPATSNNASMNRPGEPLSQRAQQFLRPVVGIDPTSIRVHRDAQAAQVAAAQQADAVTTGNDILLAAGHAEDTPETLALLAHEATHIARKHEPRFVPPILSKEQSVTTAPIPTAGPTTTGLFATAGEEVLAVQVEQQAFYHAQQQLQHPSWEHAAQNTTVAGQRSSLPQGVPIPPDTHAANTASAWGGLPAPWEPLPDWLTTTPIASTTAIAFPSEGSITPSPGPMQPLQTQAQLATHMSSSGLNHAANMGTANSNISTASTAPVVSIASSAATTDRMQRADTERSINTVQQINSAQPMTTEIGATQAPEPDLDDLARQVYAVLKRRLGVEQRRMR